MAGNGVTAGNWLDVEDCPFLSRVAWLKRLRFMVESWMTTKLIEWLVPRGYRTHVGTCRDWVDLDDAARKVDAK